MWDIESYNPVNTMVSKQDSDRFRSFSGGLCEGEFLVNMEFV